MLGRIKYYGLRLVVIMAAIAPLVAGYDLYWPPYGLQAPQAASAPLIMWDGLINVHVEMYVVGSGWVDITSDVRTDDATNPIIIERGEADEQIMPPTTMSFRLNNRLGKYSPKNPNGPYYGKIGRNTPVRARVGNAARFCGEVSEFPQRWDSTGLDRWVPIVAAGPARRMAQGKKPITSPLQRATDSLRPTHYYPMTDTVRANGLVDYGSGTRAPFSISTGLPLAQITGPNGNPTPVISTLISDTVYVAATAVIIDSGTDWGVDFAFKISPSVDSTQFQPLIFRAGTYTVNVFFTNDRVTGQGERYTVLSDDSGEIASLLVTGSSQYTADDEWHLFRIFLKQVGSQLRFYTKLDNEHELYDIATMTVPALTKIELLSASTTTFSFAAVSHLVVYNDPPLPIVGTNLSPPYLYGAFTGNEGESASARIARVCNEYNLYVQIIGNHASTAMGPQPAAPVLTVLEQCSTTNQGILCDGRLDPGFIFWPRYAFYNQPSTMTIPYGSILSPDFEPTEDDPLLCNDFTVNRTTGGIGRYSKNAGALNTSNPYDDPDGIGIYDKADDFNTYYSDQLVLDDIAAWKVHVGTWDAPRIPSLTFELHRPTIRNDPVLLNQLVALDIGTVFTLTDLPDGLPPEDIEMRVMGYVEAICNFTWQIGPNSVSAGPYNVGVWDDPGSRYSSGSSSIAAVDETTTTLSVSFTGDRWVRPADSTPSFPFQVKAGGEVMTVTDVVGTTAPQTFTVIRSVNGVVKSHETGTVLDVYPATRYAL